MASPKRVNVPDTPFIPPGGVELVSYELRTREHDEERTHRLKKEMLGFQVKELATHVVLLVLVVAIAIFCAVEIYRTGPTNEEKQRAWTALSSVLSLLLGIATGKALK